MTSARGSSSGRPSLPSSATSALALRLTAIVGETHVLLDPDLKRQYEHDLTGRFSGDSALVVRPADTAEVAAVLEACTRARVGIVPQGGHTGMVGGGTPCDGEVVLNLRRLRKIDALDRRALQVTAGAGVTLAELQQYARSEALEFPIDHAARSAATIGGMVATNAGGPLAAWRGTMRAQVVGLEAVLPDGRVIARLSGLVKDNAGFDLSSLLVGSEGTLAVVTRARLRLAQRRPRRVTALFGLASLEQALRVLECLQATAPSLEAADWFQANGLRHVCRRLKLASPFAREYPIYLVVDCAAQAEPIDELLAAAELVEDSALATAESDRHALWLYREAQNETIRALGIPLKLDIAVPVGALPAFESELRILADRVVPDAELILWGHLGDGNVHVNLIGAERGSDEIEEAILRLAAGHGGSISAEHGIGRAKAQWLGLCRSESELSVMHAIKRVFDPHAVLSRGRVLDDHVAAINGVEADGGR